MVCGQSFLPKEIYITSDTYLAIVWEVGLEDVLNDRWIRCVDLLAERGKELEGLVLARKLGVVVMEPAEVKELMEDGANDRRVSLLTAVASTEDSQDTIQ